MSKTFTISTDTLSTAAKARGFTHEEYVSRIASISYGRKVCAHIESIKNGIARFVLSDSVRTH